jgi:hypothetical protein
MLLLLFLAVLAFGRDQLFAFANMNHHESR